MAKSFGPTIKKLQSAINQKYDKHILINHTQFYSKEADKPIQLIIIKQAQCDEEKQKFRNIEVFSSSSDVQIVLWLRDYWYELNGWEVPTDNEKWVQAKERYKERHEE